MPARLQCYSSPHRASSAQWPPHHCRARPPSDPAPPPASLSLLLLCHRSAHSQHCCRLSRVVARSHCNLRIHKPCFIRRINMEDRRLKLRCLAFQICCRLGRIAPPSSPYSHACLRASATSLPHRTQLPAVRHRGLLLTQLSCRHRQGSPSRRAWSCRRAC